MQSDKSDSDASSASRKKKAPLAIHALSGIVSGAVSVAATYPLDLVKTRLAGALNMVFSGFALIIQYKTSAECFPPTTKFVPSIQAPWMPFVRLSG